MTSAFAKWMDDEKMWLRSSRDGEAEGDQLILASLTSSLAPCLPQPGGEERNEAPDYHCITSPVLISS